jgi:hypothetical protein
MCPEVPLAAPAVPLRRRQVTERSVAALWFGREGPKPAQEFLCQENRLRVGVSGNKVVATYGDAKRARAVACGCGRFFQVVSKLRPFEGPRFHVRPVDTRGAVSKASKQVQLMDD